MSEERAVFSLPAIRTRDSRYPKVFRDIEGWFTQPTPGDDGGNRGHSQRAPGDRLGFVDAFGAMLKQIRKPCGERCVPGGTTIPPLNAGETSARLKPLLEGASD
jgi:hypothetical protein